MVSQTPIGSKVKVKLLRQKKELELEVTIAELPKKLGEGPADEEPENDEGESNALSGVIVRELTPDLAKRFGLSEGEPGVVVVRVDPGSRAAAAGIRPGDSILQVNQKDIESIEDYNAAVRKIKAKDRALLLVRRKGQDLFLTIKPE
jgi:serine protease Do